MIIPNKSTIAEEEIEVPYGREVRESGSTARDRERERAPRGSRADEDRSDYGEDEGEENGRPGGLAALSARLQAVGDEDEEAGRSGEDYFDKMSMGRASAASDRSFARGGRNSVGAEEELRREYEYKIATMQQRITGLEREVEESREKERVWAKGEERVRAVEDELRELRHVSVDLCVCKGAWLMICRSVWRRKRRPCLRYSRSSRRFGKNALGSRRQSHDGRGRMRRNFRSCANAVKDLKRSA